jgi:hypothetical protein
MFCYNFTPNDTPCTWFTSHWSVHGWACPQPRSAMLHRFSWSKISNNQFGKHFVVSCANLCTKLETLCAGRKYGVFHWGLLVSGLLLLVLVVVLALVLFIDVGNTTLVLSVLAVCLIVVGISACIFLQWLHRRALRRRDEGAKAWIHHTISGNQVMYWGRGPSVIIFRLLNCLTLCLARVSIELLAKNIQSSLLYKCSCTGNPTVLFM